MWWRKHEHLITGLFVHLILNSQLTGLNIQAKLNTTGWILTNLYMVQQMTGDQYDVIKYIILLLFFKTMLLVCENRHRMLTVYIYKL